MTAGTQQIPRIRDAVMESLRSRGLNQYTDQAEPVVRDLEQREQTIVANLRTTAMEKGLPEQEANQMLADCGLWVEGQGGWGQQQGGFGSQQQQSSGYDQGQQQGSGQGGDVDSIVRTLGQQLGDTIARQFGEAIRQLTRR